MTEQAESPTQAAPFRATYQFPAWWGGAVVTQDKPKIAADIVSLRQSVKSLAARAKQGVKFKVKAASELFEKLQQGLNDLDMTVSVSELEIVASSVDSGSHVTVKARIRFGSSDGSYTETWAAGQGVDNQDKAGGKANTYAFKAAVIMALCLPENDLPDADDEGEPSGKKGVSRVTLEGALAQLETWDAGTLGKESGRVAKVLEGRDPADAVVYKKAATVRYKALLAASAAQKEGKSE